MAHEKVNLVIAVERGLLAALSSLDDCIRPYEDKLTGTDKSAQDAWSIGCALA